MKAHVSEAPTNWSDLPDITETEALSDEDRACLADVMEVLSRHKRTARFGVSLLHSHFPMAPGEFLLEECDIPNRTLTIRPVTADKTGAFRPTSWRWDNGTIRPITMCGTLYGGGSCGYPDD